jgi:hypothetical protein
MLRRLDSVEWVIATLSFLSILLIPTIGLMIRLVVKWTKAEGKLEELARDMSELVKDKDQTHKEMLSQMRTDRQEMLAQLREDRTATNKRLRWLEENVWSRKGGNNAIRRTEEG